MLFHFLFHLGIELEEEFGGLLVDRPAVVVLCGGRGEYLFVHGRRRYIRTYK
jgi:hypothetical protein